MRKLLAGLGAALAVPIMALAMAPPNASTVGTGSPDSQVTLFVDHAALAGRPGGAVLTDISSYTDQLGAIALADSIDPMGSVALTNSTSFAVARDTHTDDIFGGPMASAGIRKLGVAFVGMKRAGAFPQYTAPGSA